MKSNKLLYVVAIIALNFMACIAIIKANADPAAKRYDEAISAAESFEEQDLCVKAITSYQEAAAIKDSIDLRFKIADLCEKGYINGELSSLKERNKTLEAVVTDYPKEVKGYDKLLTVYDKEKEYAKCAQCVRTAFENKVESEVITNCYNKLRFMYSVEKTGYDSIECFGSILAAVTNNDSEIEQTDEQGNVIFTTDENGKQVAVTKIKYNNEYIYLRSDGSASQIFNAIDMSPPSTVDFGKKESHVMYFVKEYGNSIDDPNKIGDIYASIVVDGVRSYYVENGEDYEATGAYGSGVLVLKNTKTGKYIMLNTSGETISSDTYDYAGCYSNSVIYVEQNGEKNLLGSDGKKVNNKAISEVVLSYGGKCSTMNRAFIKHEGQSSFSMINIEDYSEVGFECEDADLFYDSAAAFKKNGKWGFVLSDGKVMIEPEYEEAKSFANGYAAVKKNGKWGYINKKNEMIVEPNFDDALYFDELGTAYVHSDEEDCWMSVTLLYMEK